MLRLCTLAALAACVLSAQTSAADTYKQGHSHQGDAFDSGPRQKPWLMSGIGHVHFPITTKNPEVQQWLDQGVALLHSFWFYEAERSFRWCLILEPDNAMACWGLSRAADRERGKDFLREAVKRKDQVTSASASTSKRLPLKRFPTLCAIRRPTAASAAARVRRSSKHSA